MNKNLNVLQIIDSLNPGGAEMMAVNIANGLQEIGVNSHICATRVEGSLKNNIDSNVGYLFLNKKSSIDIKALWRLRIYVNKHQISFIHAHSSSYFNAFLLKLIKPKVKLIWHNHYGNTQHIKLNRKIPLVFASKLFNAVISVNKALNEWAITSFKNKKCYFIPNFAVLNEQSKTTTLKGEPNKRIICLANLRVEKDHFNLLEAFQIVIKSNKDWTLHFVGKDLKDAYSNEIKDEIYKYGLTNHVFLYDSCSDIKNILEQATIGVLSSKFEGLPVALLEYGLAKLPVVVTNVGECDKVVEHNTSGLVVKPNDFEELGEAILYLIKNENKRIGFGNLLFESVQANYSKETYMNKLIAVFNFG